MFLKTLYKVTASANKDIVVNVSIRKDVPVSINKESITKSSSMYLSGFRHSPN